MLAACAVPRAPMMTAPPPEPAAQRQFRSHKALPRPRTDRGLDDARSIPARCDLVVDTSPPAAAQGGLQPLSPRTLKHESRRIGPGPDLPPTPPSHSRNSSTCHSALPSSPTVMDSRPQTPPLAEKRNVATPPDQRSPPTPDVTPPGPAFRPRDMRPLPSERSRNTTNDSQTESFKTAREEPLSSDDDDDDDDGAPSTVRPAPGSSTPSRNKSLPLSNSQSSRIVRAQALDLALGQLAIAPPHIYNLRTRADSVKFGGDWGTPSDVEQEWENNLERVVAIRRHAGPGGPGAHPQNRVGAIPQQPPAVPPTSAATKAVRHPPLRDVSAPIPPPKSSERGHGSSGRSNSDASAHTDTKRSSGQSIKSSPSTVVEAILLDLPPQRQPALRHVQKQRALRQSSVSHQEPRVSISRLPKPIPAKPRPETSSRPNSHVSVSTTNSIFSGLARRQVWENGGIPVVVVPDRRSSDKAKSSREPSLRSTSSRRSKRAASLDSTPRGISSSKFPAPALQGQPRQGRRRSASESGPLDQRTMDFPPPIPARFSSLSAPTSRNPSRAGSLTADSLRALESLPSPAAFLAELATRRIRESEARPRADMDMQSPTSSRFERDGSMELASPGRHDDAVWKKCSRNTPFSIASFDTTGTAPEVSEALAVHMYPHQNSSVLVVNHSAKPSEESESSNREAEAEQFPGAPRIRTTRPDEAPATPSPQHGPPIEVDSPLRNPRPPPQPPKQPPAINFIPATPSGATPADEKLLQLGNYYEATGEKAPPRRPSLMSRALSRRRRSAEYPPPASKRPGLLGRTFSRSRNAGHFYAAGPGRGVDPDGEPTHAQNDDPTDQDRLHPHWRPQWSNGDGTEWYDEGDAEGDVYRYPPVDNRPREPKRGLGAKLKRTFAILPIRDEAYHAADRMGGPERRTVRRTPSGSLRVMRRRASAESVGRRERKRQQPLPVSDASRRRGFWRGYSLRRRASKERARRRSSIGSRLEEIQLFPWMVSERRREKRTEELRRSISGPKDVRDGVREVIEPMGARNRGHHSEQ